MTSDEIINFVLSQNQIDPEEEVVIDGETNSAFNIMESHVLEALEKIEHPERF